MVSVWYAHPRLYDLGMRLIHGRNYTKRFVYLAGLFAPGTSVLDIGCGSCLLEKYVRGKNIRYVGWDLNRHFVKAAQRKGLNVYLKDCTKTKIPRVDYVVISDVLHHIARKDKGLVKTCLGQAQRALIVVEPFSNPKNASRKIYRFLRDLRKSVSFVEHWFGENDGSNDPHDILIKPKEELIGYLDQFGRNTKKMISDELFAVYRKH